jgi:hypothetical protein
MSLVAPGKSQPATSNRQHAMFEAEFSPQFVNALFWLKGQRSS